MLTIIDEEANRMDRFIDEAVQLARVEASELSLKKEPHNLARLIPAAIEEMGALAGHRPHPGVAFRNRCLRRNATGT